MIGAVATVGASLLGSILANRSNSAIAQKQMDFQERMSNTSYQRRMEDLTKAGINPMFAINSGGASAPAGAGYQSQDIAQNAVSSALQYKISKAQIDNLNSDTSKNLAEKRVFENQSKSLNLDSVLKEYSVSKARREAGYDENWLMRYLINPIGYASSKINMPDLGLLLRLGQDSSSPVVKSKSSLNKLLGGK